MTHPYPSRVSARVSGPQSQQRGMEREVNPGELCGSVLCLPTEIVLLCLYFLVFFPPCSSAMNCVFTKGSWQAEIQHASMVSSDSSTMPELNTSSGLRSVILLS